MKVRTVNGGSRTTSSFDLRRVEKLALFGERVSDILLVQYCKIDHNCARGQSLSGTFLKKKKRSIGRLVIKSKGCGNASAVSVLLLRFETVVFEK